MRNSFSLLVYFLFVQRRDVKFVLLKSVTASDTMKLISFSTVIVCLAVTVNSQNNREESFPFSVQFQTPNSLLHSSDSSIYLPPESHTPIPFYALNNFNKLPYQLLPSTASKAPSFYPTSFPIILSSTLKSAYDDEDDEELNEPQPFRRRLINIKPDPPANSNNSSASGQKNEVQIKPKVPNYSMAEKRFDLKSSDIVPNTKTFPQSSIKPAARRMIITSELQKIDHRADQEKSPSMQTMQYIQAAPGIYVSSTTEPAIPILRLSNEMDLDGSFSYEALGADQTHYVQHSHMENLGTDKEEQVVEGSYSYVGNDGKTYTVHYIADSNGYRASGDHLPVPPPIPEIIQRAVQYNLAEEAKKPPHLKSSWENDENEYHVGEESRHNAYHIPPPRSLFTGRTPEAFSFGFSQTSSPNSLTVNSQPLIKNNVDITAEQYKAKSNNIATPISPQITFLASQGAHNPSIQSQPHYTKSVSIEKPSLPQLMNYEAQMKEPEQEANKSLWRWQYGINSNVNDAASKNSISRSSSGSDDVYINFSDLTPSQYKEIMQSQILGKNIVDSNTIERSTQVQYSSPLYNNNNMHIQHEHMNNIMTEKYQTYTSTERNNQDSYEGDKTKTNSNLYSELITSYNFTPQSQVATQTYNVEDSSFEPTQRNIENDSATKNYTSMYKNYYQDNNYIRNDYHPSPEIIITQHQPPSSTMAPLSNNEQYEMRPDEQNNFKPLEIKTNNAWTRESTTTETAIENIVKENIFLRNLFKVNQNDNSNSKVDSEINQNVLMKPERNTDNTPKFNIYERPPPQNDFIHIKPKPFDLSDVLNYVAMKNHFESIKTKPKTKPTNNFSYNFDLRDTSLHNIPNKNNNENRDITKDNGDNHLLNNEQQKEMHGLIKNYKVLQRRKNLDQKSSYLPEPQRNIKAFHTQNLPPLGRAGPSMKSYMPPTYL